MPAEELPEIEKEEGASVDLYSNIKESCSDEFNPEHLKKIFDQIDEMPDDQAIDFLCKLSEVENPDKIRDDIIDAICEKVLNYLETVSEQTDPNDPGYLDQTIIMDMYLKITELSTTQVADWIFERLPDHVFKYPRSSDGLLKLLGTSNAVSPGAFISTLANTVSRPETLIHQEFKDELLGQFNYHRKAHAEVYDTQFAQMLDFENPEKFSQTAYMLNALRKIHNSSRNSLNDNRSQLYEKVSNWVESKTGSYILYVRAKNLLDVLKKHPDTYIRSGWEPVLITDKRFIFRGNEGRMISDVRDFEAISALIQKIEATVDLNEKSMLVEQLEDSYFDNPIWFEVGVDYDKGEEAFLHMTDDQADYLWLIEGSTRSIIESDFSFNLADLTLEEQFEFLSFLKKKTIKDVEPVKEFCKKFGVTGIKTFLSLEHGREFGDRIIEIGEKLDENDARVIFERYSNIVDTTGKIDELIGSIEGHGLISQRLTKNARGLLEEVASQIERGELVEKNKVYELLRKFETDNLLFFHSARVAKEQGNKLNPLELRGALFERKMATELSDDEKAEMMRFFDINYDPSRGFSADAKRAVVSGFTKACSQPFSEFSIYRFEGKIKSFCRIDDVGEYYYFGSFNTEEGVQGAGLGEAMMSATIDEKRKEKEVRMDCSAIIPIGAHYIERGFVANGFYNLAGMPSMALSSLDIEKLSSRSGECEREVVDQILLGHSILVGRPNIGFASGETQDSLAQSIESFINSGFVITRYFKNKELNKWIVIAEKNSVIPSEIREAA